MNHLQYFLRGDLFFLWLATFQSIYQNQENKKTPYFDRNQMKHMRNILLHFTSFYYIPYFAIFSGNIFLLVWQLGLMAIIYLNSKIDFILQEFSYKWRCLYQKLLGHGTKQQSFSSNKLQPLSSSNKQQINFALAWNPMSWAFNLLLDTVFDSWHASNQTNLTIFADQWYLGTI